MLVKVSPTLPFGLRAQFSVPPPWGSPIKPLRKNEGASSQSADGVDPSFGVGSGSLRVRLGIPDRLGTQPASMQGSSRFKVDFKVDCAEGAEPFDPGSSRPLGPAQDRSGV